MGQLCFSRSPHAKVRNPPAVHLPDAACRSTRQGRDRADCRRGEACPPQAATLVTVGRGPPGPHAPSAPLARAPCTHCSDPYRCRPQRRRPTAPLAQPESAAPYCADLPSKGRERECWCLRIKFGNCIPIHSYQLLIKVVLRHTLQHGAANVPVRAAEEQRAAKGEQGEAHNLHSLSSQLSCNSPAKRVLKVKILLHLRPQRHIVTASRCHQRLLRLQSALHCRHAHIRRHLCGGTQREALHPPLQTMSLTLVHPMERSGTSCSASAAGCSLMSVSSDGFNGATPSSCRGRSA